MPPALLGHASPSESDTITTNRPRDMDVAEHKSKPVPAVCPTDDDAAPKVPAKNKQSLDYVWRSGLAGGLAGCAVSYSIMKYLPDNH